MALVTLGSYLLLTLAFPDVALWQLRLFGSYFSPSIGTPISIQPLASPLAKSPLREEKWLRCLCLARKQEVQG